MDVNIYTLVILRYHIFCSRPPYPTKLFPWAWHSSPPWQDLLCHTQTNRNWTQKDSTYNSLKCEVEKKGSEVKIENLGTIHAKNCLHRSMWNGSTIRQNPVYVDALSNPFTQYYSQVTINLNVFNGVRTFCSYSQLSWIVHFLQNLLSWSIVKLTSLPIGTS